MIRILDPTHGSAPAFQNPAERLHTLAGQTVGIISNGKEGTRGFFSHLEDMLRKHFEVAEVIVRVKSSYSAPADASIMGEAQRWAAAVTGLGD